MDLKNIPLSKAALIAGISLIIMTILSFMIFFPSLQATPFSISGILIIIILDIIVALALYFLLRTVNKNLSLIMSICRIIYAVIFSVALYNISDLAVFNSIWDFGLLIFGIHIFFLGFLVYNSKFIPKWIAILLFIGSLGYITDTIIEWLGYTFSIGMFTFFGEPLFALWLVIKGRKISRNYNNSIS